MGNLFIYSLEFQWVHLLHFGGNHNRHNPNDMQFTGFQTLRLSLKIAIHDLYSRKVCFGRELIRGDDFDHPVKHPGPEPRVNLVSFKEPRRDLGVVVVLKDLSGVLGAVGFGVVFRQFSLRV